MGKLYNPRRSCLTKANLIGAATVTLVAGQYVQLGVVTISAGVAKALGFGKLSGQDSAEGRLYVDLKDTAVPAVDINGMVRLELRDPEDTPIKTMYESRTETLRTSATDRTQQVSFPERPEKIGKDYKIAILVNADVAATLSQANSTILMDITNYTNR